MWMDLFTYGGAAFGVFLVVTLWYCNTSRAYRIGLQDGTLVRQRKAWLFNRWFFNRSEEDYVNRMQNELLGCEERITKLKKLIPEHLKRLEDKKKDLIGRGTAHGDPFRDKWSARREPVMLQRSRKLARRKKERTRKPAPKPLMNITPAN